MKTTTLSENTRQALIERDRQRRGPTPAMSTRPRLSALQAHVNALLGISDELFFKFHWVGME